jgi:hypothetical protein
VHVVVGEQDISYVDSNPQAQLVISKRGTEPREHSSQHRVRYGSWSGCHRRSSL